MSEPLRLCVAGATGWAGRAVTEAILSADDLQLVGAVARRGAGRDVGELLGIGSAGVIVAPDVVSALKTPCDVLVDYTNPAAVKANVLASIARHVSVVIGTSGLDAADFAEIDAAARGGGVGVIASGNFSITAALATHFTLLAARYLPHWEILDYASAQKVDVPSGTVRELAERLETVRRPEPGRTIEELIGPKETRGADIGGSRVHSVRLPSYVIAFETIFGLPDERLTIRHDSGTGANPYVAGTLLAIRRAPKTVGLTRGLDRLLFGEAAS